MNEDRWKRIEEVFQGAAELTSLERPRFLDRVCADDPELRREVESLLSYDLPDGDRLASAVAGVADTIDAPGTSGDRIGPYRVKSMLGEGGMGAVYLAERDDDQFRQLVAVKLLKRGMERGPMLERFLRERRILARLDHPNIARLLDGGTTAEGVPYLVMEYVDGRPLLDYCRDENSDCETRLKLFRDVCSAVQYAHRNLVVHRDIKPNNILVSKDGTPKLLDFGIAKLLDSGPAGAYTARMLTPDYASPEQVLGEAATTATDVYSLGALLYELLTFNKPLPLKTRTRKEIQEVILKTDPVRPSTVTADRKLRKKIEGDLDNIVLMALRKEPHRRYSSPDQFSEDVRRYLEGMPVRARQDTLLYRTRKFAGRAKWALAAAAAVALSLGAAIVAANVQAQRAERRFAQVRRLANTFLFDFHDRIQSLPGSTEAREMVVRTALEYLNSLEPDAEADSGLQWDVANAYEKVGDVQGNPFGPNLGRPGDALKSYQAALAIKERLAAGNAGRARSLAGGYLKMGDVQIYQGDTRGATATFLKALEAMDRLGRDPATVALRGSGYMRLGQASAMSGDLGGTVDAYRRAVQYLAEASRADPSKENRSALGQSHMRLGYALQSRGDLEGGLAEFRGAVETTDEVLRSAPDHPGYVRELLLALVATGDVLGSPFHLHLDNMDAAIPYYERALTVARRLFDSDPKNAQARLSLSTALRRMGTALRESNPAEALRMYREALSVHEGLADSSTEVRRDRGFNLLEMAFPLARMGDSAGALKVLREAVDTGVANASADPARTQFRQDLIPSRLALGAALLAAGDPKGAQAEMEAGLSLAEAQMKRSPESLYSVRNLADSHEALARLARARGDAAEAAKHAGASLALWTRWEKDRGPNPYQQRRKRAAAQL